MFPFLLDGMELSGHVPYSNTAFPQAQVLAQCFQLDPYDNLLKAPYMKLLGLLWDLSPKPYSFLCGFGVWAAWFGDFGARAFVLNVRSDTRALREFRH